MTFAGFDEPFENWSKLPHAFINALPLVETIGEMKVILYILRHTWGFQEYDQGKRITLDEFENGRKKRGGDRIDNGTSLSRPTILDGLKRAEKHGFITVEYDSSDAARVKKFYTIRMVGVKSLNPGVKGLNPSSKESLQRSEKDTQERNNKKETKKGATAPPPSTQGTQSQLFREDPEQTTAFSNDWDKALQEAIKASVAHNPKRRAPRSFQSWEQKQKYRDAAAIIVSLAGEGELDKAIAYALEQGRTSRQAVINTVAVWAENLKHPKPKRSNGKNKSQAGGVMSHEEYVEWAREHNPGALEPDLEPSPEGEEIPF